MIKKTVLFCGVLSLTLSSCASVSYPKRVDYGTWDASKSRANATGFIKHSYSDPINRHKEAFKQSFIMKESFARASNKAIENTDTTEFIYLIGGTYAAGAFLFESDATGISKAVQDNLAGVGLVGGIISALRSRKNANEQRQIFSKAQSAANCVLLNGDIVNARGIENETLKGEIQEAKTFLSLLQTAYSLTGDKASKAEIKLWIDFVSPIVEQANNSVDSYNDAPNDMMLELDEIANNVTKLIEGDVVSLADTAKALIDAGRSNQKHEEVKQDQQPSSDTAALTALDSTLNAAIANKNNIRTKNKKASITGNFGDYVSALVTLQSELEDTVTAQKLIKACSAELTGTTISTIVEVES